MIPEIKLLGVTIHLIQTDDLLLGVEYAINHTQQGVFSYVNAHALTLAFDNQLFKSFLNSSTLVYTDGFGVRFAARIAHLPQPTRMTPPDWIEELFQFATKMGYRLFFLGAERNVIEKASANVQVEFPGINITGIADGYFNKDRYSDENANIVSKINQANPDILIVGFGMPKQEFWIEENRAALHAMAILPVGALFDHLAGTARRAPKWMTNHGFEWLGRLFFEPNRLWRRYVIGLPKFLFLVVRDLARKSKGAGKG